MPLDVAYQHDKKGESEKMEHMKTGEVISKRRSELELTQNQLAKMLNISFQAISKWENGGSKNKTVAFYAIV